LASTRAFRLASWWWRLSAFLRGAAGAVGRAVIPAGLRQTGTPGSRGGLLPLRSWYADAFDRFKAARLKTVGATIEGVGSPGIQGLVSVVLPVYNGADLVRESLDSLLAQTYREFEIIAIDDGSTDGTAEILDNYAARDDRVRVVHQENRKLPRSLSRGFRLARGEFLTWTSADNRCKPRFLEKMVDCLRRHPGWDMVYANVDIIGADGRPLRDASWFAGYQEPPGSEHVHLPTDPAELNTWPNNYVCAAFMYRSRVAWLLGDYSRHRFTTEDYDYWMRVNELLTLRHVDFDEPVYDYRFHDSSLTARDEELGITAGRTRLMVFDDARRDALLTPAVWHVESFGPVANRIAARLRRHIADAAHLEFDPRTDHVASWPGLFQTAIMVRIVEPGVTPGPFPERLPDGCLTVLAIAAPDGDEPQPPHAGDHWDLCVAVGSTDGLGSHQPYRRWLSVADSRSLFQAAEIRARSERFAAAEAAAEGDAASGTISASVVICTHQPIPPFRSSVLSAVRQNVDPTTYEVLVVNNRPGDPELEREIETVKTAADEERPGLVRVIRCPVPGLSNARNAAIAEARGEIVICLDDDATAQPSLVSEAVRLFAERPSVGVIGGHIRLVPPKPAPEVLNPGWERYWSQLLTDAESCREVEEWWQFPWGACWCARRNLLLAMGGFRSRYGRVGGDYAGGEEVIAATLAQRLGAGIAVAPELEVAHHVEPSRYTWRHVRQTIIAGTLVNYQAQRDLYLPMWGGIGSTLKNLLSPSIDRTVGANSAAARARHWLYRKEAWSKLLLRQAGDRIRRSRRQRHR
jgi:glycosyltransferase involved in cell wall biosynthesis